MKPQMSDVSAVRMATNHRILHISICAPIESTISYKETKYLIHENEMKNKRFLFLDPITICID